MMGYIGGKNLSERGWMNSVHSFFGGESPVMKVMEPSEYSPVKRTATGFEIRVLNGKEEHAKAGNPNSARSFYRAGSSFRSGLDSISSEDDGTVIEGTDSCHDEMMDSSYLHFEGDDDLDRKRESDESLKEWKKATDIAFNGEWNSRTRHGTFERLRRTWETQRDLLLESMKEKDDIIEKQREMLHSSTQQLIQMEASIDALETRFSRELASLRLKVEQHEQRSLKKAESMLDTRDEIEKGQSRIKKELKKYGQTAQRDIQALENALHQQTSLYSQSEQEKQAVTQRLDAANQKMEDLREQVRSLTAELKIIKSKGVQMQRSESHELPRAPREKVQYSPSFDSAHSTKGKEIDALRKENVQLKREVFEMRERLIDLKEHSEELESQVSQQEDALNDAWRQKQELDLLKIAKQDNEALLAARQKIITGLRQSLTRLQSVSHAKTASEETKILEEILAAQQSNDDIEKLLINTQSERDACMKEMHKLELVVRSMGKQAKEGARATERLKKEQTDLKKTLNCKNSEIATLQTNLRVETLKRTSSSNNNTKKSTDDSELNEDLIRELLKSKVSLAEMSELVIQLRQKVASLRNKLRSGRTNYG